jgi:hypothetical protein
VCSVASQGERAQQLYETQESHRNPERERVPPQHMADKADGRRNRQQQQNGDDRHGPSYFPFGAAITLFQ